MIILFSIIPLIAIIIGFILKNKSVVFGRTLLTLGFGAYITLATLIVTVMSFFENLTTINIVLPISYLALLTTTISLIWKFNKKITIISMLCFVLSLIPTGFIIGNHIHEKNLPVLTEPDVFSDYLPISKKVVDIDTDFQITDDLPKLDGATALYPIYISIAKSIYPEDEIIMFDKESCDFDFKKSIREKDKVAISEYAKCGRFWNEKIATCSKTKEAYRKIVDGEADIIFVAGPSEEQENYAKEKGVELIYTPIGKEAFVFFVNSKNPIDNISIEEIQSIYSGEITSWKELGINNLGKIKAFQRAEGSGSQTALRKVMQDKELITPPQEDVIDLMGGIIDRTADYKNFKNAIGFSFRFYSTEMVKNKEIKLLSLNGVEPTLENIENGTYPISSEFYAVSRKDANENTKKIIEWLSTEDAQKIIENVGYTPLTK